MRCLLEKRRRVLKRVRKECEQERGRKWGEI
jgi:hypothetical protein